MEEGEERESEEGGVQDSVSPISSSHYLSSMNGFWHQRREKQRPPTSPPALPPHIPKSSPLPLPLNSKGPTQTWGWGDKGREQDWVQAEAGVRWEWGGAGNEMKMEDGVGGGYRKERLRDEKATQIPSGSYPLCHDLGQSWPSLNFCETRRLRQGCLWSLPKSRYSISLGCGQGFRMCPHFSGRFHRCLLNE